MGKKKKHNSKKSATNKKFEKNKLRVKRKSSNSNNKSGKKKHQKTQNRTNKVKTNRQTMSIVIKDENKEKKEVKTTFSSKLEEVISEVEGKKKLFGGKVILLAAPANYLNKKWKNFRDKIRKGFRKLLLAIFIPLSLAAIFIGIEIFMHGKVFPRVYMSGVNYGFYNISEAKDKIEKTLTDFEEKSLNFIFENKEVEIPLSELLITYDHKATLESLPIFNLHANSTIQILSAAIFKTELKPIFKKDNNHILNIVEKKLDMDSVRSKSAKLSLNGEGQLTIIPEKKGIIIDQKYIHEQIVNRLINFDNSPIVLKTLTENPEITSEDLKKELPNLRLKLENDINIKYADKSWKFKTMNHIDQISYRKKNDQIVITVTKDIIENYFSNEIFTKVEKPVSNLKIFYDDKDNIVFEGKALDGEVVNRDKFINDLEMALNSLDNEIELLIEEDKARINVDERLKELGIKELIGTGHTTFAGSSANRKFNIEKGMSKFNGLLIPPGATFSFNDNLGKVDGSTGYKLEMVIKAEGTIPEYGGGICQVSSTMFKAALFTGLPITERSPHSYAVNYYAQIDGHGLDSTVYPGVKDLKFVNDTPANILIQTFVEGNHAYINFFGTSDGRKVHIKNYWRGNYRGAGGTQLIPTKTLPPGVRKQIETAHGGFDASWDRIISLNGEEKVEKIYSVYRSTSNRILVGQE